MELSEVVGDTVIRGNFESGKAFRNGASKHLPFFDVQVAVYQIGI
jgi:hypothetical protein